MARALHPCRMRWARFLARYGGVATTAEFYNHGETQSILFWSVAYGSLLRIREGWYCSPDLPAEAVRAVRVGGRLACLSALAFHGLAPQPRQLHVVVDANTSRLRDPDTGEPGRSPETVIHWSRRELAGDRVAVSAEEAYRQAARCRAQGRDSL